MIAHACVSAFVLRRSPWHLNNNFTAGEGRWPLRATARSKLDDDGPHTAALRRHGALAAKDAGKSATGQPVGDEVHGNLAAVSLPAPSARYFVSKTNSTLPGAYCTIP